ncbi:outer membrane protein assembly factor BamB family protein [Micromonospora sp. LZ34]
MTGEVVIELGERPRGPEPEPGSTARRPRPARWWRVALPVLLALGTLAGGGPPPAGPPMLTVPATGPADFLLFGDQLLVLQGLMPADSGARELVAYRLPSGEPLWRRQLPDDDVPMGLTVHGDLLLVTTSSPDGDHPVTSALALNSGELRWHRPGRALPVVDGGVLLETHRAGPGHEVRAVDVATGAPGWSVPVAEGFAVYRYTGGVVDLVASVTPGGRVQLHDPRTGARLAGVDLPEIGHVANRYLELVGDVLLVGDGTGGIAGYDAASLRRRWVLPPGSEVGWASRCGAGICLHRPEGGVRMVDPETGRTRWADLRWSNVAAVGDRLLADAGRPDDREDRPLAVLDPATGQVLGELGRWQVIWEWPTGRPRYGLRRLADGRALLAELDVAEARTEVLAVLPGWARRCASQAGALVCQEPGGTLRVWQLPR